VDAGRDRLAAEAEQPFDAEGDAERGQRPLPLRMDQIVAPTERRTRCVRSVEIDPDLERRAFTATSAGGLANREIEAHVRRTRGQRDARYVENADAPRLKRSRPS
jgi:hypothetical protein